MKDPRTDPDLMRFLRLAGATLALAFFTGCDDGLGPDDHLYHIPPATDDGWSTAHFSTADLDADSVEAFLARYEAGEYVNLHSFLLIHQDNLILEAYRGGTDMFGSQVDYDRETLHPVYSVTKSVISFLLGAARGMEYSTGPEESVADFFPERAQLFQEPGWREMTIHELLSMSTGLVWDESSTSYFDPANDFNAMMAATDPLAYLFSRPFASSPGESFTYNSGVSVLLGEVLRRATGEAADIFAAEHLFSDLDIQNFTWQRWGDGTVDTGGGLALRPRDMAKFGSLVLSGGEWGGQQVVPRGWVSASTQRQVEDRGYGYQWWVVNLVAPAWDPIPSLAAIGWGGQYIIVVPEFELVCVFTGANHDDLTGQGITVLKNTFLSGLLD